MSTTERGEEEGREGEKQLNSLHEPVITTAALSAGVSRIMF